RPSRARGPRPARNRAGGARPDQRSATVRRPAAARREGERAGQDAHSLAGWVRGPEDPHRRSHQRQAGRRRGAGGQRRRGGRRCAAWTAEGLQTAGHPPVVVTGRLRRPPGPGSSGLVNNEPSAARGSQYRFAVVTDPLAYAILTCMQATAATAKGNDAQVAEG